MSKEIKLLDNRFIGLVAVIAYNKAAIKLFGEYACLNKIEAAKKEANSG